MTQLPALSMVVLEDVDALFTNHREADQNNSSLCLECRGALCGQLFGQLLLLFLKLTAANYPFGTPHVLAVIFRSFSGFLNCLDGLGAPDDVVIFMTTNHPDKLVQISVVWKDLERL